MKYGTEKVPEDLLDDNHQKMSLAAWPQEPLRIEAADEETAFEMAKRKRMQDPTCYINANLFRDLELDLAGGRPKRCEALWRWTAAFVGATLGGSCISWK